MPASEVMQPGMNRDVQSLAPVESADEASPVGPGRPELEDRRRETASQRADRNVAELLQELRVAGIGVQVLFGFLLALPFTVGFQHLVAWQRDMYLATLFFSAAAILLLTGPVAYHRVVFQHHLRKLLIAISNTMALAGLASVALALTCAIGFVVSYVEPQFPVALVSGLTLGGFVGTWFLVPLVSRRGHDDKDDGSEGQR
jgi:Family of unknown function (DUF6328)